MNKTFYAQNVAEISYMAPFPKEGAGFYTLNYLGDIIVGGGSGSSGIINHSYYTYNKSANSWDYIGDAGASIIFGSQYAGTDPSRSLPYIALGNSSVYQSNKYLYTTKKIYTYPGFSESSTLLSKYGELGYGTSFVCPTNRYIIYYGNAIRFNPALGGAIAVDKNWYKYNVLTDTTTKIYEASFSCYRTQTFIINGNVYFCGGDLGGGTSSSFVWKFNFSTERWDIKQGLPVARYYHQVFVLKDIAGKDIAYVAGGINTQRNCVLNDVWRYNEEEDSWIAMKSLPMGVRAGSTFVLDNEAYIVGGISSISDTYIDRVIKYTPEFYPQISLDKENIAFLKLAGRADLNIICNTNWSVTISSGDGTWLSVSQYSGYGYSTIRIEVTENLSGFIRYGAVTVSVTGIDRKVQIAQFNVA